MKIYTAPAILPLLTAEVAKDLRKGRKGLYFNVLTLRTLLQLSVLCGFNILLSAT
jgi:hypothetical protein